MFSTKPELDRLTLLFCREQEKKLSKCKMHVQRHCFRSLNLLFCAVLAAVALILPICQIKERFEGNKIRFRFVSII